MEQPTVATYHGNIISDPKVVADPSSLQVGDVFIDQNGGFAKVVTSGGSFVSLPMNTEYAAADSGQSRIDDLEKNISNIEEMFGISNKSLSPKTEMDLYRMLAQEMICINQMFFNEDVLYNALYDTCKSTYNELAYSVMTDSFMPIVEADEVENFKKLLKEAAEVVKNKIDDEHWQNKVDEVIDIMSRICNKFRYDKLVMMSALKEMKA